MEIAIHWFRQDLRLSDNPALRAATKHGTVLPIYILDDINADVWSMGAASRWWLHHSLSELNKSLQNKLNVYLGDPKTILPKLMKQHNISAVFWNRCYEPWRITRDQAIKENIVKHNIHVESFNGSLLWEPWETLKADGTPYKVFTPFYKRGCLNAMPPSSPVAAPKQLKLMKDKANSTTLAKLNLLPSIPWDQTMKKSYVIGELGAKKRLQHFLKTGIQQYKKGRDFPALAAISRLSPHLHFGEISPHTAWHAVNQLPSTVNTQHFLSELAWREFSYSLLYHFPHLPQQNLQTKFDAFPWKMNKNYLKRWQQGQTGYPIVDAGMRELWQTGYMHNRVRMIVGSFLVKNLLLHWHHGEAWFWDCLVDADLANNSASWQWVAGCGADAAPYFRIFNPITQGEKFDPEGEYTLQYVPELKNIPLKFLFKPWEAPPKVLQQAEITLGKNYPKPIVNLAESRERALQSFAVLKEFKS